MKISICCPSYKRPIVETLDYIPTCRVYVDHKEEPQYREANGSVADIVSCPEGVQGNVSRIRNYIIREELKVNDAVCIIDDDLQGLYRWEIEDGAKKRRKLVVEEIEAILQRYTQMCEELGYKMWGVNCNKDPLSYRAYSPFSLSSYVASPFGVFLKGNECYYDERLSLKEDYDMTLQQCNKCRGILRVNYLCYDVKQGEQSGGCATYRNYIEERRQFDILKKKWGTDIVREDKTNKGGSSKVKSFDYNPIIKIPIGGI